MRVALERPQHSDDPLKPFDISWVIVNELFYFDQSPWPKGADGTGYPLIRSGQNTWGTPSPTDIDYDGLDNTWENSFFQSLKERPGDDWDHDGFSNLEEQISRTNPTNSASYFSIEGLVAPTLQWTAALGRAYSVYWTDDPRHSFSRIASDISTNFYTDAVHTTNNCNFYVITVEME